MLRLSDGKLLFSLLLCELACVLIEVDHFVDLLLVNLGHFLLLVIFVLGLCFVIVVVFFSVLVSFSLGLDLVIFILVSIVFVHHQSIEHKV
jgi:hypothetical protein